MENEKGIRNYRKLLYFHQNSVDIHFTTVDGGFHNGTILDLDEEKLTLVLKEFKEGEIPFLLEDIDTESIKKFTPKQGVWG